MIKYELQVICKKHTYILTKEYDEMCDYSDYEIIMQMLKEDKYRIGNDNICDIIVCKTFK